MKKITLFSCISMIIIISCARGKKYEDKFTLLPTSERIKIGIGNQSRNFSDCIQYYTVNDTDYLFVQNRTKNSVELYNLNKGSLVKDIIVKTEGPKSFYRLAGFLALNLDTIIVISQAPQILGLINSNGEVIKKISYSMSASGEMIRSSHFSFGSVPFIIGDTIFLSQYFRTDESLGILTQEKQKHSFLLAKINLKTNDCRFSPLVYPRELIGRDISNIEICRVFGYNNCLVYHFIIEKNLFVSKNRLSFEPRNLELNYRLRLPENQTNKITGFLPGAKYKISRDEVQDILYDKYRECYYVLIRKRQEELEKNPDFRTKFLYPDCIITILDKEFNHIGEFHLPKDSYSIRMSFITRKGLFISEDHINNESFSEDSMRFKLFSLSKLN